MPKTLLVVDDSITIQDAVRHALTGEDWTVVTASSQAEAVEALRDRHFDAVLCDVALGDADGYEVCKTIRATSEGAEPLVVLMGANVSDAAAMAAGASATVLKPFETAEILEVLQTTPAPPDFTLELEEAVHEEVEFLTLEPLDADASILKIDEAVEIIDLSEGEDFADLEVLEDLEPVEAEVETDPIEERLQSGTSPAQLADVSEPFQENMTDLELASSPGPTAATTDLDDAGLTAAGPGELAVSGPSTTTAATESFDSQAGADIVAERIELDAEEIPTAEPTTSAELLPELSDLNESLEGDFETSEEEGFELRLEEPPTPLEDEDFLRGAFDLEIDSGAAALDTSGSSPEPELGEEPGTAEPEWSPPSADGETDEHPTMVSEVGEDAATGLRESRSEGDGGLPNFAAAPEIVEPHDLAAGEPFTGPAADRQVPDSSASALPSMPELSTAPQADAQFSTPDPWAEDGEERDESSDTGEMPAVGESSPTDLDEEPSDAWEDKIPEPLPRVVVESAEKAIREALESSLSAERLAPVMEAVVERVVWEVVPELAERLIQEAIDKLRTEQPPE